MSHQFYWAVCHKGSWNRGRSYPQRFHFRYYDAKNECARWNSYEKGYKHPKKWFIMRVRIEFKDKTHYDVYKHEVKRV